MTVRPGHIPPHSELAKGLRSDDWIKSMPNAWDLRPYTIEALLEWLDITPLMSGDETQEELNRFYQMPAAQPMPEALQLDLIDAGMMSELGGWAAVPGGGKDLT